MEANDKIYYSVDGGKTWLELHDTVRISQNIEHPEEGPVQLVINCTHEGVIQDVNKFSEDGLECENIGTSCLSYEDIVDRLIE